MKRFFLLVVALVAGLTAMPVPAAAPPCAWDDRPHDQEIQDIVYLGDVRPVYLRLRVRVDGKPLLAAFDDFMDKLFNYLDVNGDGILDKAESERIPPPSVLFGGTNGFFGGGGGEVTVKLLLNPPDKNAKVTRQGLAESYRNQGVHPFRIGGGGIGTADYIAIWDWAGGGRPSSEALNKRLFELLDTDKDGKLSKAELAAAPKLLQKLDSDDDEVLTSAELMGQASSPGGLEQLAFVESYYSTGAGGNQAFHPLTPGKADSSLAAKLTGKYGKGSTKLTREMLGLDKETFALLDTNSDGALDMNELASFGCRPADLELGVKLTKGKTSLEVLTPGGKKSPLAGNVKKVRDGELLFELGSTRIELGAARDASGIEVTFDAKAQYSVQFKAADRDNNGYLDEREAGMNPLFSGSFKAMDRDGDGKLFEKEVFAYLDSMESLRKSAQDVTVQFNLTDRGRGLYDLVDRDGDGRLSLRELRNMVKLLAELDRDGDGKLAESEVPRSYRADFQRGSGGGFNGRFLTLAVDGRPAGPVAPRTEGPLWFRKMDRNRDGDVSRREFLGTDEEFARIDKDGDGLISLEEALAADKELRAARLKK